jgi:AraC-like DNA-binding protein
MANVRGGVGAYFVLASPESPNEYEAMGPWLSVPPPYDRAVEAPFGEIEQVRRGTILAVAIEAPERLDHSRLRTAISELRARIDTSIAICVPRQAAGAALPLALRAYACGVRAVFVAEDPPRRLLWSAMADLPDLPGDVAAWLQLRRRVPDPLALAVARLLREAPSCSDLDELSERLEVLPRTLHHRFDQARLPGPSQWYHLGRLLDAQFRLLRDPGLDVGALALELGYSDRLSFTNRIYRLFGVTAETSRKLLGLEWRLAAWWERVTRRGKPCRQ